MSGAEPPAEPRPDRCPTDGLAARSVYRRRHRLSGGPAYKAVFDAKLRKSEGPLTVFVRPNGLGHPRLGLSVGRRAGGAVTRNRYKRMVREAFRLEAPGWMAREMGSYDVVVSVRPHRAMRLEDYRRTLTTLVERLDRTARKRAARRA